MAVKHAFNCAIADDPASAAAGMVLPSHWDAVHLDTSNRTINVFDYLSAAQQADVIAWTATLNVTAAITSAITALPSTGGELYFPAGRYKTSGGFTLSVPCTIRGAGKSILSVNAPTSGVTQIECGVDAVNVFTFNTTGFVTSISIVDTIVATRTSGDAIVIYNATDYYQRVDVSNCLIYGFWNAINGRVTNSCHITNNDIESSLNYCIILDNEVLADAGDNNIGFNLLYPGFTGRTSAGAIRVRNGGNKIIGNGIVKNAGNFTYGILADIRAGTSQLVITGNKIETGDAEPIKITYPGGSPTKFNYVVIVSNIILTSGVTAAAIDADAIGNFVIGGNVLGGSGTNALNINNSASGIIMPNVNSGSTNNYNAAALNNSTKSYWDASTLYLGSATTAGVALINSSGSLTVKEGSGVSATDISASIFKVVGSTTGSPSDTDLSFTKGYNSRTSGNVMTFNSNGTNYGVMGADSGGDRWYFGASTNGLNNSLLNTSLSWTQNGNVVVGSAALATNATNGFFYMDTCAGVPSGTPTAYTGRAPMVYDTTNNNFYIYNGGWKKTTVFA